MSASGFVHARGEHVSPIWVCSTPFLRQTAALWQGRAVDLLTGLRVCRSEHVYVCELNAIAVRPETQPLLTHVAVVQELLRGELAEMLKLSGSSFKVELVMRLLGLSHARDTMIGSAMVCVAGMLVLWR